MKRILAGIAILIVACFAGAFLVFQIIPFGRAHVNPQVVEEPAWNSPETRDLAQRACFDCHSNLTNWPWYSNIAPVSWLVQRDVDEGREKINFSEWGKNVDEVDELGEVVDEGEMPPRIYLVMHPEAQLSAQEKQILIEGFQATFGAYGEVDDD